jgi:hypothetical protein
MTDTAQVELRSERVQAPASRHIPTGASSNKPVLQIHRAAACRPTRAAADDDTEAVTPAAVGDVDLARYPWAAPGYCGAAISSLPEMGQAGRRRAPAMCFFAMYV